MLDSMGQTIMCCCGLLYLITTAVAEEYQQDQVQHIREWTAWFNTDSPTSGTGDDESLASIRKRGFSVCYESTPVDALCRISGDHSVVFNVGTTDFTDDVLVIPCTSIGIVCRNKDQGQNRTCKDYGIRFQCLSISEQVAPMNNLGLIGIAAGLSVIVPILCVTCMHVTRLLKERNQRSRSQDDEESSEGQRSSFPGDLPPSYSALFGEGGGGGSTEQLLSDSSASAQLVIPVIGESGDYTTRRNSISATSSDTEHSGSRTIYSIPDSPRLSRSLSLHTSGAQRDILPQPQSRRPFRFPGMHLSIIDLILAPEESSSTCNQDPDDQSYIQTPPPTYNEAIIFLGGVPYKSSDVESCMSDTDTTGGTTK